MPDLPSTPRLLLLWLLALPAAPRLHPLLLVPGDGGSQVEGRLNKTDTVHYICERTSDWFDLWLNIEQLVPEVVDCWVDNMKMVYNPVTRRTSNNPGVETRIPGFGNSSTVEYLDKSQRFFSVYFANIVSQILPQGYQRGSNLHGAPYDFRKAANEHEEYFVRVKTLIEETYSANQATPVIILTHSMGSPMMLYFLLQQSQAWKSRHIRALVTLSGPWGGTVRALKVFAVGDNLGNWLLSEKKLMWEQRTSSSLAWLMPQDGFWGPEEVLVQTVDSNYTQRDYKRFFSDLEEPNAWMMREDTAPLLAGLPAPGVEVFCLHGGGVATTERLVYGQGEFPGSDPSQILKGDGDGTVNMRSLLGCTRWATEQVQPVHHHVLPGVDHMEILRGLEPAKLIATIIENINKELYEDARHFDYNSYPKVELV